MSSTSAEKAFYIQHPPRVSGQNVLDSAVTGAAAAASNLWGNISNPRGKCMVTFEALTTDAFIRLRADNAASTTNANGLVVKVGTPVTFWVNPAVDLYVDHIAPGGAGRLKWYISSPVFEGVGNIP